MLETRIFPESTLEFREAKEGDPPDTVGVLEGYSIVFNSLSVPIWDMFYEKVSEELEVKSNDVLALYSHRMESLLGRESAKTLVMTRDKKGIHSTVYLPDTTDGNNVRVMGKRKDIKGQSFGFYTLTSEWEEKPKGRKLPIRTLKKIELIEVSAVALPAYPKTTAKVRQAERGMDYGASSESPEKFRRLLDLKRRQDEMFKAAS